MKNLTYKAVENSKNTSGEGGNNPAGGSGQLTTGQIAQLCNVAASMGCTHFFVHLPMDTDAQMQANYSSYSANYNLMTLEQYTQAWCDAIHNAGMKVVHRGTWCGIKNEYGFAYVTYGGGNFVALGSTSDAAGETSYCAKMKRYLATNVGASHIESGDIFAPISECTEYLSNASQIWFDTSGGTQAGLQTFFTTLHTVVSNYGTSIGKSLDFFTIVNYSEYNSGYLGSTLPADTNHIAIDYYGHSGGYSNGQHVSPSNYVTDWNAVRTQVGAYPLFQTEMGGIFGDSWPTLGAPGDVYSDKIRTYEDSCLYQIKFWKAYRDSLVDTSKMNGVSNWGFWSGQNSSIVFYSSGSYQLNYMGQIYANFIKGNGMKRIPVPRTTSPALDSWGNRTMYF